MYLYKFIQQTTHTTPGSAIVNHHLFYAAAELATCSVLARCGYGTLEALPPNY